MKKVLIISPHFPPVNAPDMHRVRLSLPYYRDFGWDPVVLACPPDPATTQALEPLLAETLPTDLAVHWVKPMRPLPGLRNLAWRSLRAFAQAGDALLRAERFDLVFFSTTQFTTMTLGPRWRQRFGVPFVCDLQDPWVNDYYDRHPEMPRPGGWKHHVSQAIARYFERRTLRDAAGLVSVSAAYPREISARYPGMPPLPQVVLPFGADERDWRVADLPSAAQSILPATDAFCLVSVGRGGADLQTALGALAEVVTQAALPPLERAASLHLIGTSYATAARARPQFNLAAYEGANITEHPARVGYFCALRCMRDADAVVVLGSRDPGYQPSKLHVVASSGRPVIAVVWPGSGLHQAAQPGLVDFTLCLTKDGRLAPAELAKGVQWLRASMTNRLPERPPPRAVPTPFHARTLTRRQTEFFAQVASTVS